MDTIKNTKMSGRHLGFTLMEVLVVLTILILLAGFTLFVSLDSYRGSSFRGERDTAVSVLQKARSQAMNNVCLGSGCSDGLPHGVHFDGGSHCTNSQPCYIIFQGASINFSDSNNQQVPVENSVTITASSDIIFNQLDGGGSGGTVVFTDKASSHTSTISINTEGQITWTN